VLLESRDLAQREIWERSLERSIRRRELLASGRKEEFRRKRASVAVSAAMATAPFLPTLTAASAAPAKRGAPNATSKLRNEQGGADRILLEYGSTQSGVMSLQRALHITVDGIYGPITERAVRDFQRRAGLPATGKVDVKTWLRLFPRDAILYQSPTAAHAAEWAAVTAPAQPSNPVPAVATDAAPITPKGSARHAKVASVVDDHRQAPSSSRRTASHKVHDGADASGTHAAVPAPHAGSSPSGGGRHTASSPSPGSGGSAPHLDGSASGIIATLIGAANRIDAHHYAYRWGGGHNSNFAGPYDCSGAVSAVLHAAGLVSAPMVSGDFMHWGKPGRGAVTIYANASHVYMSINGRFFGTSYSNPGGGAGWFRGSARPGFVAVHVPLAALRKARRHHASHAHAASHAKRHSRHSGVRQHARPQPAPSPQSSGRSSGTTSTWHRSSTSSDRQYAAQGGQTTDAQTSQSTAQSQPAKPSSASQPTVQQPANQPVQQSAPAPAPQSAPAPVQQTAPAPVQQTAPAPVQQTAPAPVQQTAPAPAPAPTPAPAPAPVQQSAPAQPSAPAPAPVQQSAPAQPSAPDPAPAQDATPAPAASAPAPDPAPKADPSPAADGTAATADAGSSATATATGAGADASSTAGEGGATPAAGAGAQSPGTAG
jgi:peptidoglycan hydrolase-like protein with peptidoglycan-binding domain